MSPHAEPAEPAEKKSPRNTLEARRPSHPRACSWARRCYTAGERGQCLLICLDDTLDDSTPKALGLGQDDLFICRDVALSDELAANLALQCRLKTV